MISLFCFRLICGMSLCWLLMPRRQVTCGFFRIQHMVTLGLAVLGTLALVWSESSAEWQIQWSPGVTRVLGMALAVVAYAGSVVWTLDRRRAGLVSIAIILLLSIAGVTATTPRGTSTSSSDILSLQFDALSSAWLLGTALTAMLLGHWYLTATSMPLTPLVRLNQFLISAALLRSGVVGLSLTRHSSLLSGASTDRSLMLLRLAGLVGPFVLGILVTRILRYRNTQSATGVLFAAVILVFMGEMAATLLTRTLGWPL